MLPHCFASKIGLGTVQWGLDYGVSNIDGRTSPDQVQQILQFARSTGISVIDTARDYGCAEQVLGGNDTSSFSLCTKIPSFKHLTKASAIENHFRYSFNSSLEALNKDKVEYLLLHDCDDLLSQHGPMLISLLQEYKDIGRVNKIGFSAYTSSQISSALDLFTSTLFKSHSIYSINVYLSILH